MRFSGHARSRPRINLLAIFPLAHALETRETVTGDGTDAIVEGLEGPLLDGRRYGNVRRSSGTRKKEE